jgi:hypothetical protein
MAAVSCPQCSQSLELPDTLAGKTVQCPHCQHMFAAPASSAMASGKPLPRSTDDGVTAHAPSHRSGEPDSADLPGPGERHDIAKKSSGVLVPILLVGAVVALVLCVCGGPVVMFLGFVPLVAVRHEQAAIVAVAEEARADAELQAANAQKAKAPLNLFAKGAVEAADAIAKDKLLLKEYPPLPAPAWHRDYIELLKERCKCDYQVIGGKLNKDQEDEIRGWNETMRAELSRRHGPNILAELNKDAEQRWRDRINKKDK